jgi:molybdenum cofactor cytidylyltransferase
VIHALVLAAGESRRMGMPKPLLRFRDSTFLEQIVSVLQRSEVGGITVVLGAQAPTIRASIDLSGVSIVINEDYREGQLSSLIAGLRSLPPEAEAVLVCLVDSPFITAEIVKQVVEGFHETGKPIVVPAFEGRRGHPTLFARAVFEALLTAPAQEGARYVLRSHEDKVFEMDVPEPAILARIDTPEDYLSHFGVAPEVIR